MNKRIPWETRLFLYSQGMKQGDLGVGQRRNKAQTMESFQDGSHKAVAAWSCGDKLRGRKET